MKTLFIGVTIVSILLFASMAHADDYNRGKGYSVEVGYYGPSVFRIYSGYGNGLTVYAKGYGRHYRGYGKYYRGYGRHYKGYGGYYRGYGKHYYGDRYYGRHKPYKFLRHRPYGFGYGYKNKYYRGGYKYRSPGYRGYR
jgi:hypothetical protein